MNLNKTKNEEDSTDFETENLVQEIIDTKKTYILNIDSSVDDAYQYRKIFDALRKAKDKDTIKIVINTFGGYVHSFVQLHNALLNTKAKTIAEIYTAYSVGGLIAFSCDEIEVGEFSSMLIHSLSFGSRGKADEVQAHSSFISKTNKEILSIIFKNFLTISEIDDVLKGKDFWFDKKQIEKRLKNWVPIRKRKSI